MDSAQEAHDKEKARQAKEEAAMVDVVLFVSKVNTNDHKKTWVLASKVKKERKSQAYKELCRMPGVVAHKQQWSIGTWMRQAQRQNQRGWEVESKYKKSGRSLLGTKCHSAL